MVVLCLFLLVLVGQCWPLSDRVTRLDNLLVEAEAGAHTFLMNSKLLLREEDEFPF